jgi:RNA polymerase sigma factor (sigma-70 family)
MAGDGDSERDPDSLTTFNEYRNLLFSIAYRMLGTVADAEDMLQDAFIRWQQAPRDEIRSPKAFLVTIVSRLCINQLRSARVQREEYVGQWLPEPVVTDPASDPTSAMWAGESISMAFLVLLERLNPIERAVFLLREVFDYDYPAIAAAVGRTEANCRQILRRAREHVQRHGPGSHPLLGSRPTCSRGSFRRRPTAISMAWSRCSPATPSFTPTAAVRRQRANLVHGATISLAPSSAGWPSSHRRYS